MNSPDRERSGFEQFIYPMMIRESHLDTFGHVNNATYLEILEEARWEFIQSRGFGLETIKKLGLGPTILSVELTFTKELRNRQQITITTQVLNYPGKVGELEQTIESVDFGRHARALFKIGLFDVQKRRLVDPTPEWLQAIGYRKTS